MTVGPYDGRRARRTRCDGCVKRRIKVRPIPLLADNQSSLPRPDPTSAKGESLVLRVNEQTVTAACLPTSRPFNRSLSPAS